MIKVEYRKIAPKVTYRERRDKKNKEFKQMLSIMFPEGRPKENKREQLIQQSINIKRRYHERYT